MAASQKSIGLKYITQFILLISSVSQQYFLDTFIQLDHPGLFMNDHRLVHNDHLGNVKRGRVSTCCKSCLPLRGLNIHQLTECIILEAKLTEKSVILLALSRSLSQYIDEFDNFLLQFEEKMLFMILTKPTFLKMYSVLDNFNARSSR